MFIDDPVWDIFTVAASLETSYQITLLPSEQELVVQHLASQMESVNKWGAILPNSKLMNPKKNFKAIIARLKTPNVTSISPESRLSSSKLLLSYRARLSALLLLFDLHLSPI